MVCLWASRQGLPLAFSAWSAPGLLGIVCPWPSRHGLSLAFEARSVASPLLDSGLAPVLRAPRQRPLWQGRRHTCVRSPVCPPACASPHASPDVPRSQHPADRRVVASGEALRAGRGRLLQGRALLQRRGRAATQGDQGVGATARNHPVSWPGDSQRRRSLCKARFRTVIRRGPLNPVEASNSRVWQYCRGGSTVLLSLASRRLHLLRPP
eukprot:359834-Chlamydomonas_euryale.AAC.3